MKTRGFLPTEIIFAATTRCNLHCPHCFVRRGCETLSTEQARAFLKGCKGTSIERVGFSGGEPFLYTDFLIMLIKESVQNDFLFDRIMTNGDWWRDLAQLNSSLMEVYDAGYDGKIGLSWDLFHNQKKERIFDFCRAVLSIFGEQSLEIQSVVTDGEYNALLQSIRELAEELSCQLEFQTDKRGLGTIFLKNDRILIQVAVQAQVFPSDNSRAWMSKKWFKEDFCQGPGNILFVHTDGSISPCCGFANENAGLKIGTIQQSFSQVMENAKENRMLQLCFYKGLSSKIKEWKRLTGSRCKTSEICTFCDEIFRTGLR